MKNKTWKPAKYCDLCYGGDAKPMTNHILKHIVYEIQMTNETIQRVWDILFESLQPEEYNQAIEMAQEYNKKDREFNKKNGKDKTPRKQV